MSAVVPWQVDLLNLVMHWAVRVQRKRILGRSSFFENLSLHSLSPEEENALRRIVQMRQDLSIDQRLLEVRDYGTGGSSHAMTQPRSVSSTFRSSAIPHWWGVLLFHCVRRMRPKTVLELGTNLGVSAAYMQSALDLNGDGGTLISIEGDAGLVAFAREVVMTTGSGKTEIVVGTFAEVLPSVLLRLGNVDLAFIDGHHEFEPTLRYFGMIEPYLSPRAGVIFDDIYLWSRPVRNAWKEIVRQNGQAVSFDLAKFGILFPKDSRNNRSRVLTAFS